MTGCDMLDYGTVARKNGKRLPCESLAVENARLRESCSELLRMAESNDPDFLHWPEIHDELRKLGVKIVKF